MKHSALTLATLLSLASAALAGTIDGVIAGKIATGIAPKSGSSRPAAVWLQGLQPEVAGKNPVMAQRGGQFVPTFLIVVAGQTVSMPNQDNVAHNVYSTSETELFNLGFYGKDDTKTVTFDQPGAIDVRCVIHSFMRATILVVPNKYYSAIAPDGTFHIRNVPPRKSTLTFWADGLPSFTQEITFPDKGNPVVVRATWPTAP